MASALAGAVLLFELLAGRDRDDIDTDRHEERRGYFMTDATLTEMGTDGRPRMVVHARDIEQQLADDSVLLKTLQIEYSSGERGNWTVTANNGRIPPDRRSLLLSGEVTLTGDDDAHGKPVIVTDRLTYDSTADFIQTPELVSIHFGRHVLGGRGLRVDLNAGTLRLESNVNGRFTP